MIYAIEIQDKKFVKIGFSANEDIHKRVAELQTGCPFQIRPIFTTYGTLRQEQSLHAELRTAFGRIRIPMPPNEWYPGKSPFFTGFLEYLKYGPDAGLAYVQNYAPEVRQPGRKEAKTGIEPNYLWQAQPI